jgi:hypothetical protein
MRRLALAAAPAAVVSLVVVMLAGLATVKLP